MRVKAIMSTPAISVSETTPLSEATALMGTGGVSGLVVVDGSGRISGILSEGDLLRRAELGTATARDGWWSRFFSSAGPAEAYMHSIGCRVSDVMTPDPITVDADDALIDAARLMEKHRIRHLPVLRDGLVVGVLRRSDFVDALKRSIGQRHDDAEIPDDELKKRVLLEIARHVWSSHCSIRVEVEDGRVTLSGTVPTDEHRSAIRVAVENALGVACVDERLEVTDASPIHWS